MTLLPETQSIETERLLLRRIEAADLDYFAQIHADADVARYISHGQPRSRNETGGWLDAVLASYENANLGQLAVSRKSDGQLIGRCGLSDAALELSWDPQQMRKGWFFSAQVPTGVEFELLPELGYTFGKEYWGHGYASEAAGRIYEYARQRLSLPVIMSTIHAGNHASLNVANKFGVEYVDQVELAGRALDRYHWPMR